MINNDNYLDMEKIYAEHIEKCDAENFKQRYKGNEEWYHGSSAGKCVRKTYYDCTKEPISDKRTDVGNRVLRIGTITHDDLQKSVRESINTNNIYNIYIEEELVIKELNVRGFADLITEHKETNEVHLYDFKTIGEYPFKLKFGFKPTSKGNFAKGNKYNELQLGTYGIAVQEKFGRLDGMHLVYINKNTQEMRHVKVGMGYLKEATNYWEQVNKKIRFGIPPLDHMSPNANWECNYCQYKTTCKGK